MDATKDTDADRNKSIFWDSTLVAAGRDMLLMAVVFLYLIGFFFHGALVKGFGIGIEFVDQPTWQMLEWAWDALQIVRYSFWYPVILICVFALMSRAGYIRQTALAKNARKRWMVYGLVCAAIVGGIAATIIVSSNEGNYEASGLRNGDHFPDPSVHFTAKSEAKSILEILPGDANLHAKSQWYLIAESSDRYHIFRRDDCGKRSSQVVYSILKADVISYDQSPAQDSPTATESRPPNQQPTPQAPSPPPQLLQVCP